MLNNRAMPTMLVDIATVYYRAYFSMPESMTAPHGQQINAVRGTFDALMHFVHRYQPQHLVTAWDLDWRPEWRVALLDTYKTARVAAADEEQMPDTLSDQVDLIRTGLSELGVPCIGVEGFEADDIVAQYVRHATGPTYVVSGDRDLFQLVDDERQISVLYLGTGVAKHSLVNNRYIEERFGIRADQYAHFSVLRGDASDGLPGVRGIGEKTAASLLREFGDLQSIQSAARFEQSTLKPKIRQALLEHEDYLRRACQVVILDREVIVPETNQEWKRPSPSPTLDELGMTRYVEGWHSITDY